MADEPAAGTPAPSIVNAPADPAAAPSPPADPAVAAAAGAPKDPLTPPEPEKKDPPAEAPAAFAADKLTLPEGMKSDDPLFKSYADLMSDDKIAPQERGQKLLDLYTGAVKQAREAGTEAWNNVNKEWQGQTMADAEIGGAKFPATKATIAKAIDSLPADLAAGFRQALDVTGAGNHPAMVKALHTFATRMTEGGHVTGAPKGSTDRPSVKDAFYPNSPDMK